MRSGRLLILALGVATAALLGACGGGGSGGNANVIATGEALDCSLEALATFKDGVLTAATESPSVPPYFEGDDPTNGRGFESSVAYAIAEQIGFSRSQVEWVSVPVEEALKPGLKGFDFAVSQIAITPDREKVVDFSVPYYEPPQAVLVAGKSRLKDVTSVEDLKDSRLAVLAGSSSLAAIEELVDPSRKPESLSDTTAVLSSLREGKVDAAVVDLPTAILLLDELPESSVVGLFNAPEGESWGAVLARNSPLTECVNLALETLTGNGAIDELSRQWMGEAAGAPVSLDR